MNPLSRFIIRRIFLVSCSQLQPDGDDHSKNIFVKVILLFVMKPLITIEYCPKCGWMLRATYFAQELLTTFTGDIHGVLLHPSEVSGTFKVLIDNAGVFDRKREGRFPETKELKQLVRDVVNPGKDLGHSERK